MNYSKHKTQGFSLVEALIAVLVLSVGLIALARLQGTLMQSSGVSKARSEAVAIAQQRLEQLRNIIFEDAIKDPDSTWCLADAVCSDIGQKLKSTGGSYSVMESNVAGINATYTVSRRVVDQTNPTRKDVSIQVQWTHAREGTQTVVLSSVITWKNPGDVLASVLDDTSYGFVQPPRGQGQLTKGKYAGGLPAGATQSYGADMPIYIKDLGDGKTEVIDSVTGDAMTVTGAAIPIYGNIYAVAADSVDYSKIFILASDASICAKSSTSPASVGAGVYEYQRYMCVVATDWYGKVGILLDESLSETVCVGDPYRTSTEMNTSRSYRGYRVSGGEITAIYGVQSASTIPGIGDDSTGDTDKRTHDFLVADITSATNEKCAIPMAKSDPVSDTAPSKSTHVFYQNFGDLVCLTNEGTYCPPWNPNHREDDWAPEGDSSITISGRFLPKSTLGSYPGDGYSVNSVDLTDTRHSGSECRYNNVGYLCNAGAGTATLAVDANKTICESGWWTTRFTSAATKSFSTLSSSVAQDFHLASNASSCGSAPSQPVSLVISGSISVYSGSMSGATLYAGSTQCAISGSSYSCSVTYESGGSWSGTFTMNPPANMSCLASGSTGPYTGTTATGPTYHCFSTHPQTFVIQNRISGLPSSVVPTVTVDGAACRMSSNISGNNADPDYMCDVTVTYPGDNFTIAISLPANSGYACTPVSSSVAVAYGGESPMDGPAFSCAAMASYYTVSGTVTIDTATAKTTKLAGMSFAAISGSCGALACGCTPSSWAANVTATSATFSCIVPPGYNGAVSVTGYKSQNGDKATKLDFSSCPVYSNKSGMEIKVYQGTTLPNPGC